MNTEKTEMNMRHTFVKGWLAGFVMIFQFFFQSHVFAQEPVLENMKKAAVFFHSISVNGGYAGIYSLDLGERYGEAIYEKASKDEIWNQPPGTPTVGTCYLRAYHLTSDRLYLDRAVEAGLALAWGQSKPGGWDHRSDVSHMKKSRLPLRRAKQGTYDDNITQGVLTFLMDLDRHLDESWLTSSIDLGLKYMIESQFPDGAWPQWYPLRGGYHDYYTFNDNALNDCIRVLLKAHQQYGRKDCLDAALCGGDFIILSQLPEPQTGWAQQYSHDLKPAWARAFEPPAVCSAATLRNIQTLVDLYIYTGEERFLKPIPKAFAWLEASKIGPGTWARLYEVGTNTPIYGDRDSKVHYTLAEISEERQNGYRWQGDFGFGQVLGYYNEVKELGIDRYREAVNQREAKTKDWGEKRLKSLEGELRSVLQTLDGKGRWVEEDRITCFAFVRRFSILCDYVEAYRAVQGDKAP